MEYEFMYSGSNLPDRGCFLGNGKLAIKNSGGVASGSEGIQVEKVLIARNVDYKNGQFQPNVVEMFNPFGVEFFAQDYMYAMNTSNVSQYLNMDSGIAVNEYRVGMETGSNDVGLPVLVADGSGGYIVPGGGSNAVVVDPLSMDVGAAVYCARHLPYSAVMTLTCSNVNKSGVRFVHTTWTGENLVDVMYENSVKYVGGEVAPLHLFVGHGRTHDGLRCAFASCYMFETPADVVVRPMGMGTNLHSARKNYQFNSFDLSGLSGGELKLHVVNTFVTQDDFDDPRGEVMRIVSSICSPHPLAWTTAGIMSYMRGRHVDAWAKLWNTKVVIAPKLDASAEQVAEVRELNRCLYSALYHIYSCVRENFQVDNNPDAIPIIDVDGSLIYEADIWLIPLLLILKPDIARSMIEYRAAGLQQATQLAASYGFEGAKVPYVDDIVGYKNNLYYNTAAYVHLFNTCMVAINTWNYYRVSQDKDWLRERGFGIMKGIAAYLTGVCKVDEISGEVSLESVIGLGARVSAKDNVFTNNLVKLAVRYAVEASYELNYVVPDEWLEVYNGLPLPRFDASRVFKVDEASVMGDIMSVVEPLHIFVPGFWENVSRTNSLLFAQTARENAEYYDGDVIVPGDVGRPVNLALRAITTGVAMSMNSELLVDYMALLGQFLNTNVSGPWRLMRTDFKNLNKRPPGLPFEDVHSLTTSALFVSMILQGVVQMRIIGGISDSRFYYENMTVAAVTNATMPSYWAYVTVQNYGTGNNKGTVDVRQNAYDMAYDPPNVGGGAYIMTGDFSAYTP